MVLEVVGLVRLRLGAGRGGQGAVGHGALEPDGRCALLPPGQYRELQQVADDVNDLVGGRDTDGVVRLLRGVGAVFGVDGVLDLSALPAYDVHVLCPDRLRTSAGAADLTLLVPMP